MAQAITLVGLSLKAVLSQIEEGTLASKDAILAMQAKAAAYESRGKARQARRWANAASELAGGKPAKQAPVQATIKAKAAYSGPKPAARKAKLCAGKSGQKTAVVAFTSSPDLLEKQGERIGSNLDATRYAALVKGILRAGKVRWER